MHWTILMLSGAVLVTARLKSDHGNDFGLDSYESKEIYDIKDRQIWNPVFEKDFYVILNRMKDKSDSSGTKITRKRALSALSRWKPLGSLGIRMKAIHRSSSRAPMVSMIPEMNLLSGESGEGVRPLGQPLRWGRKR